MGRVREALAGRTLVRHLLVGLVGLVVAVLVVQGVSEFRSSQLASMAYLGIAAGGLSVLTGLNGQLSLGHGALMAVGAYTAAVLLRGDDPWLPLPAVLVASTVTTLVVGAVIGVAAARLTGPYIAGATLALAVAVPGVAVYFDDFLGGEQGLNVRVPPTPDWFADAVFFVTAQDPSQTRYLAYVGWIALVVTYVLLANLAAGRVGRTWRAVRDDDVAAELAGIRLGRSRVLAFAVSAACAGLAGGVMALVVRLTAPSGFSLTLSLTLVSAVVLGGLGTLSGALVGAAILSFLPQVASQLGRGAGLDDLQAAELAPLVQGVVLVLVVLLAPAGLVGSFRSWWALRAASPTTPASRERPAPDPEPPPERVDQHPTGGSR